MLQQLKDHLLFNARQRFIIVQAKLGAQIRRIVVQIVALRQRIAIEQKFLTKLIEAFHGCFARDLL